MADNLPHSTFKLGKKAERPDARTFKLKALMGAALPEIPKAVDWAQWVIHPGMMRNDEIGLCVIAGKAHQLQAWAAVKGQKYRPTDQEIVDAYVTLSGLDGTPYDPATGANDDGLVILDALNYWRKTGLWGRKIGAFAKVDHKNLDEVRAAIALFGGVTVGANLPITAQKQQLWRVDDASLSGEAAPNSWGGHDMFVPAYSESGFTFISWGARQQATTIWWESYVGECWVALSEDWVSGNQPAPSGFDMTALQKALNSLPLADRTLSQRPVH